MRLASGVDLDLDLGVAVADLADERLELRLVRAREQRQDLPAAVEQALRHRSGDRVEALPARDGGAVGEPEPRALRAPRSRRA